MGCLAVPCGVRLFGTRLVQTLLATYESADGFNIDIAIMDTAEKISVTSEFVLDAPPGEVSLEKRGMVRC